MSIKSVKRIENESRHGIIKCLYFFLAIQGIGSILSFSPQNILAFVTQSTAVYILG